MRIYGLTGGTGSGKSAAARHFESLGIPVIDADQVGHEVIEPGGAAEEAVVAAFGEAVLTDGAIDREKLGGLVFRDAEARERLNGIVHPAIRLEMANRCAQYAQDGHRIVIIDAALLGENGTLDDYFAGLILVLAPTETRVQRLTGPRGIAEDEARRRIAAQRPPEDKVALARWVIENTGTLEELYAQVERITGELKQDAA
jgi:dephospho-CoA kinase